LTSVSLCGYPLRVDGSFDMQGTLLAGDPAVCLEMARLNGLPVTDSLPCQKWPAKCRAPEAHALFEFHRWICPRNQTFSYRNGESCQKAYGIGHRMRRIWSPKIKSVPDKATPLLVPTESEHGA
jgi:hypothetical protein